VKVITIDMLHCSIAPRRSQLWKLRPVKNAAQFTVTCIFPGCARPRESRPVAKARAADLLDEYFPAFRAHLASAGTNLPAYV